MKTTTLLSTSLLLSLVVLPGVGWGQAQAPASPAPAPVPAVQPPAEAAAPALPALAWEPPPLQPFSATYQAFYKGKEAGDASMQVTHTGGNQWRVDMQVVGRRGFASVLGLNIEQSTVFEERAGAYAPLSQSTVRKGLFLGKKAVGTYNWQAGTAQWTGDVEKKRAQPIPLQPGDQSALLINLAIMRDARPGATMHYRYVDMGKVRQHDYQAAPQTENVEVGDLSYNALRVYRTNGGNNETILWIANGVPTPVRILQREDGEDRVDLRLIEYQGV
ncbi:MULTISPECIES: DUF3108 domain-containing protein [Stenotrophomonas]|uniref:DUF3108 domain-containing protein n=1 Tax=Stenotrophomonas muris TaxID=2963283 RepID=A0ABU5MMC7_9GAMM|nr:MULTISPECIES: DUF3108 domain-containing protein [Stenotrophomonas]KKF89157.1 hypothetical protein XY58_05400 [Stenotrophomonas maltophilia]MBA0254055.1 DUF3108 domain-containing protein [Stenotrophomonas maltophilia]MBA0380851.1 DUF3108 domain-containing protein [Stenotrophomonas maltophilia]MBA0409338.1 DUF3108 domain-containing protein [Stenotrophomonas maltophilia]MBA0424939.1 DUF3108 domain-containing protein [Stenotrophomonas maltophilia]